MLSSCTLSIYILQIVCMKTIMLPNFNNTYIYLNSRVCSYRNKNLHAFLSTSQNHNASSAIQLRLHHAPFTREPEPARNRARRNKIKPRWVPGKYNKTHAAIAGIYRSISELIVLGQNQPRARREEAERADTPIVRAILTAAAITTSSNN